MLVNAYQEGIRSAINDINNSVEERIQVNLRRAEEARERAIGDVSSSFGTSGLWGAMKSVGGVIESQFGGFTRDEVITDAERNKINDYMTSLSYSKSDYPKKDYKSSLNPLIMAIEGSLNK